MKTSDLILFGAVGAVALVAVGAIKRAGKGQGATVGNDPAKAYAGDFLTLYFPPVNNPAPGTSQAYNQFSSAPYPNK